jgi:hypothetical protein
MTSSFSYEFDSEDNRIVRISFDGGATVSELKFPSHAAAYTMTMSVASHYVAKGIPVHATLQA